MKTPSSIKTSFAPIEHANIEILILGSMPGEKSLQEQEYYAHLQNRFWKVMAYVTKSELPQNYDQKTAMLLAHNIGLWDIVHQAERVGSLDTAIENESPNDLESFIEMHKKLKIIAFNGKKSETLYRKYFNPKPQIQYVALPSTSPANAGIRFDGLCEKWSILQRQF